jgi:hypothetical protein
MVQTLRSIASDVAALRRAIVEARGDFSVIQPADLGYNPNEYVKLWARGSMGAP